MAGIDWHDGFDGETNLKNIMRGPTKQKADEYGNDKCIHSLQS